ncbi:MAG: FHA domain-containing protein [Terriglobales bacterium]
MARLYLKFGERVIQEVVLIRGVVTIGRQPDNLLPIDNPAVSGHHARVYWKDGQYVLEDFESFNGTYLNNSRIKEAVLADRDVIAIGKHTVVFCEQSSDEPAAKHRSVDRNAWIQDQLDKARLPQLDPTMFLDTQKAKGMVAQAAAAAPGGAIGTEIDRATAIPSRAGNTIAGQRRIGTLTILEGKTDREHYLLPSKLSAIGRSKLATIRLKKWFAPRVAASIQLREDRYFIVAAGKTSKIVINGSEMVGNQQELRPGDVVQVAGIKAKFDDSV